MNKINKWYNTNKISLFTTILIIPIIFLVKENTSIYRFLFYYIFLYTAIGLLPNYKTTTYIVHIIRLPGYLLMLLGPLLKSFYMVLISTTLTLSFFFVFFTKQHIITNYELNNNIIVYLGLLSTSIFLLEFNNKIITIVLRFFEKINNKKNNSLVIEFSHSILHKNKIRFFIYLFYFVFLVYFSTIRLQGSIDNNIMLQLNATFYSFSSFLAYEKITQNLNLMNVNIGKTLKKLIVTSPLYTEDSSKEKEDDTQLLQ